MPTGRPPKPTALKILNGSAAHHPERRSDDEPQPEVLTVLPDAPEHLARLAQTAWVQYGTAALGLGVLAASDLAVLEATAAAYADYRTADNWHERDAAWKRWVGGLGRLGLSPSDRTRLHAAPKAKADPMAELIARRNQRKTS